MQYDMSGQIIWGLGGDYAVPFGMFNSIQMPPSTH